MKRMLVTTDLSVNSRSGLRFAIQLASQNNYKLTFFHVYHIMKPTKWNEMTLRSFENSEYTKIINKLQTFVGSLYDRSGTSKEESEYIAKSGVSTAQVIMQYAEENNYDYICISRKGIGMSSKFFGSSITKLINKSKVPVIAVPNNYKRTPIKKIMYASDLTNFDREIKRVTDFTGSLNVQVELLHYKVPIDYLMLSDQSEKIM
jgi:nucleotide-binding universal stress UspA family protein